MKDEMLLEALTELKANFIKDKALHHDFKNMFDVLNVRGYKRVAELNMFKKLTCITKLERFAINNYDGLMIPEILVEKMDVVPRHFYTMGREAVNEGLIVQTVQDWENTWIQVEEKNREFYVNLWYDLIDKRKTALATYVKCLLDYTECKLKKLKRYQMDLNAQHYDIELIMKDQMCLHDHIRDHKMPKVAMI